MSMLGRKAARERVWELLAAPPLPKVKAKVVARGEYDGAAWEKYEWQLPWGPKTEAVFLKPANAKRVVSGCLAILGLPRSRRPRIAGWKKIADIGEPLHPMMVSHRNDCYSGKSWANEAVKRGYAVLVPDTFLFGSRKVNVADVIPPIANGVTDPAEDAETEVISKYNDWAGEHESIVAKSLFLALERRGRRSSCATTRRRSRCSVRVRMSMPNAWRAADFLAADCAPFSLPG